MSPPTARHTVPLTAYNPTPSQPRPISQQPHPSATRINIRDSAQLNTLVRRKQTESGAGSLPLLEQFDIAIGYYDNGPSLVQDLIWLLTYLPPLRLRLNLAVDPQIRIDRVLSSDSLQLHRLEKLWLQLRPSDLPSAFPLLSKAAATLRVLILDVCTGNRHTDLTLNNRSLLHSHPQTFPRLQQLTVLNMPSERHLNLPGTLLGYLCRSMPGLDQLNVNDAAGLVLTARWSILKLCIGSMNPSFVSEVRMLRQRRYRLDLGQRLPGLQSLETSELHAEAVKLLPHSLTSLVCGYTDEKTLVALSDWVRYLQPLGAGQKRSIQVGGTESKEWRDEWLRLYAVCVGKGVRLKLQSAPYAVSHHFNGESIFSS